MNSSFRKKTLAVIVICIMMQMSLPVVMADGCQKEKQDNIVKIDGFNCETHVPFATAAINSEPTLKVKIGTSLNYAIIYFTVENIGDATARNVTYSNISFEGNILYNSRSMLLAQELEPNQKVRGNTDLFIGLGLFTVTINVTCDEGISGTTSAKGIVFGPFYLIP